jgi:hypothetical protein
VVSAVVEVPAAVVVLTAVDNLGVLTVTKDSQETAQVFKKVA